MRVDDPLGLRRGARRVTDDRRAVGIHPRGLLRWVAQIEGLRPRKDGRTQRWHRAVFGRDHHHQLEVGQIGEGSLKIRHVVLTGEAIRCDEHPRAALAEDVSHLFGPVDMDDRNEDNPEGKESVETGDRLSPIRKLEGDDVSGGDAVVNEGTGEAATHVAHASDGADVRADPGADPARDPRRVLDPVRRQCRPTCRRSTNPIPGNDERGRERGTVPASRELIEP